LLVVLGIVVSRRGDELKFADLLKQPHPWWQQSRVRGLLLRIPGVKKFMQELKDAPKELLHDKALLLETTVLQFAIFVLDAASLGACLLALGATASPGGLFAAILLFRGFTLMLPLVPGVWLAHREMRADW
jgi:uncharacterized membrane protein YbhN (UPF0104 family)